MKTIEAPEKIFLHPDIGGREFVKPWFKSRLSQESIEYTRTDVFIDKACNFVANYCFEHPHCKDVLQIEGFNGLDDFLNKLIKAMEE